MYYSFKSKTFGKDYRDKYWKYKKLLQKKSEL